MKKLFLILLLVISFTPILHPPSASAHTNNSEGYSLIEVNGNDLEYELKVDLAELGEAVNKEMAEQQLFDAKVVQDYINSHIDLYADSVKVKGTIEKSDVETMNDKPFAVININYKLERKPEKLVLNYHMLLDDTDPSHANYATIQFDGEKQEAVLSYESRELEIGQVSFIKNITQFFVLGLKHIFTGFDHILFVVSLLFGAKTMKNIASLVTAFTLAHSVTLALATLELVQLPGMVVESAIALSIVYVALTNILNPESRHQPWLAFAFGLIHGFGFAGILNEMHLDGGQLASSLVSFNIGIEIGQLFIVSAVFPVLLWIRKLTFKPMKWVLPGTSVAILGFGLVWFIQRVFQI